MTTLGEVRLRRGYDTRYLNIDVDGVEIGHLVLAPDGGQVISCWADDLKDREVVMLVRRCYVAALESAACHG